MLVLRECKMKYFADFGQKMAFGLRKIFTKRLIVNGL